MAAMIAFARSTAGVRGEVIFGHAAISLRTFAVGPTEKTADAFRPACLSAPCAHPETALNNDKEMHSDHRIVMDSEQVISNATILIGNRICIVDVSLALRTFRPAGAVHERWPRRKGIL